MQTYAIRVMEEDGATSDRWIAAGGGLTESLEDADTATDDDFDRLTTTFDWWMENRMDLSLTIVPVGP